MNEQLFEIEDYFEYEVRNFGHPADEAMFPEISCYDDYIDNEIDRMIGGF